MAKNTVSNPDLEQNNPDIVSDRVLDVSDRFGIDEAVSPVAESGTAKDDSEYVTVCIPARPDVDDDSDFVCTINGKKYRIPIGVEVKVKKFVWDFYLSYCGDIRRNNSKKKVMSDSAKDI